MSFAVMMTQIIDRLWIEKFTALILAIGKTDPMYHGRQKFG